MPIDDVQKAISHCREMLSHYEERIKTSETRTRYAIIDPIIWMLGWQTHYLNQCETSYQRGQQGLVDYALFNREGRPIILIEAKRLGINPAGDESQIAGYALGMRDGVAVLTNGQEWILYDLSKRGPFGSKYVRSVDIRLGSIRQAAQTLNQWLRKSRWW